MKTKKLFFITCLAVFGVISKSNAQQWNLDGNGQINPATNFIGTTDLKPLVFKINNVFSGTLNMANTSFGYEAMSNATGNFNSAFGVSALMNVGSGNTYNSAFGFNVLKNTTTGGGNTAMGHNAMITNMTGQNNTAIGFESLYTNNGGENVAVGMRSSYLNSTGTGNTALGYNALRNNSVGNSNVAVGLNAIMNSLGSANTSIGGGAGAALVTGNYNTFVGNDTAKNITNGSSNTFLGMNSGSDLTSGNSNSFFGVASGKGVKTGYANTFIGSVMLPNSIATGTTAGSDTSKTIILADGLSRQRLYIHSNGFAGIGLDDNVIPQSTLEIRSLPNSPSLSGLRLSGLTSSAVPLANPTAKVLSVNATGDVILVNDLQGTGGAISNALTSSVNTMTSTVNTIVATAPIINSVANTITSGQLTTTVNGVASAPLNLPSLTEVDGSITNELQSLSINGNDLTISNGNTITLPMSTDMDQQTLSVSGNQLTIYNGNTVDLPSLTEVDGDVTNEIQHLSQTPINTLTGLKITLSQPNASPEDVWVDGSETKIQAGTNVSVTGSGTTANPYIINSTATAGSADINIYKDNGTITPANGVRTVTMNNNNLVFDTAGSTTNGRVYIGNSAGFPTTTGNYRLNVEGGILTEKVKVALRSSANWADYVFADNYKLMPLKEVEAFVKANKHLPGVISAENLTKEGLDLGQMQAKQMEKIEELTLYVIDQNKTIEKQSKEIEELKAMVNALVNKNK